MSEGRVDIEDTRDIFAKFLDNRDQAKDKEAYKIVDVYGKKFKEDIHLIIEVVSRSAPKRKIPFRTNKTNQKHLGAMFGTKVKNWIGKVVVMAKEPSSHKKAKDGKCLRVYGSPDIQNDISVVEPSHMGIGKTRVLKALREKAS